MVNEKLIVKELIGYYDHYKDDPIYRQHLKDTIKIWEINASDEFQPYREAYRKAVMKIKENNSEVV